MDPRSRRSPARFLAPLALIVVLVAFLSIVTSPGSNGGGSPVTDTASQTSTHAATTTATTSKTTTKKSPQAETVGPRTYTVQVGDTLGSSADLRRTFTAPAYNAASAESKINLRRGERMKVRDLLTGLLLESANDAAVDLAVGVAGSRDAFVHRMNVRARQLGLAHTHYANPIGLDAAGNYSTARDLATLARRLMTNPTFAAIADKPSATLRSGDHPRTIQNRNLLIGRYRFVDGVKTGHTSSAGYVLVGAAHGNGGHVISVVLGEPSEGARDVDTLALLRWGIDRYRRVTVLRPGHSVARVKVAYHPNLRIRL